jgi:hypothetical protein
MQNYILNIPAKQVTFLDNRFYQTESGEFLPSVTTILQAYPKDAGYFKWLKEVGEESDTIRDEAGRRGSIVHTLTEQYDNGDEVSLLDDYGRIGYKMGEWAMFERYVEYSQRFQPEIVLSETNFINPDLGFAGTIDRVVKIDGKTYLIDIKTSNAIYDSYWLQLMAYKRLINAAYGKNVIDECAILWLNAKTRTNGKAGDIQGHGWQMVVHGRSRSEAKDWELFEATHKLWIAQNEAMKPKQITYQLTHKK